MTEKYLRLEIKTYLVEQMVSFDTHYSTALLCLLAAINDYSFSDDMINDLTQFIPSDEEIKKYR